MKRTLIAICITTVALAVGATAEEQHQNRAAGGGKGKAAATVSARGNRGGNVQRSRQVSTRQNVRQNTSARAFNQHATVNSRANAQTTINRSNTKANRVASRERGVHRNQATVNNTVNANATTNRRFNRERNVSANTTAGERFNRNQNVQRQRALAANTNRNVTINRTRNVNRNVTLVNNWRGDRFAGRNYVAFRNYHRSWHDRGWWTNHYGPSLTFVFGSPYFWNSGYWYPAWGYNPGYVYSYDGPIYGAQNLSPDQIVQNVQAQLRDDGYYGGPIDGVLGPQTRYALAAFQADHGLAVTSAVDEPTLSSLGLV